MENPLILWGGLAIVVPILIHLWHKKRGKVLYWAAMSWLNEKSQQQARGLKLENLLLLLLRILAILLLVLYLAKPIFEQKNKTKVHWVFPDKDIVQNYKFELEQAQKKGEPMYWLSGEKVESLNEIPSQSNLNIQAGINRISESNTQAEIYLNNLASNYKLSKIYSPVTFHLNILNSSVRNQKYYRLDSLRILGVNNSGMLQISKHKNPTGEHLGNGALKVLIETDNKPIYAALNAIEEVYGLNFEIDTSRLKVYDWAFTNHSVKEQDKLTFVFSEEGIPESEKKIASNVVYFENNEIFSDGSLPEIILQTWLSRLGLDSSADSLSHKQIKKKFEVLKQSKSVISVDSNPFIFIFLILILCVERWIALSKNV